MGAAEAKRPRIEEPARGVKDEDVVRAMVGEQEEAAVAGLNHLVAVSDGVGFGVGLAPEFVDAVAKPAVADERSMMRRRCFAVGADVRGDKQSG